MRKGLSASEAGKLGAIKSAEIAAIKKQQRIDDWNLDPKLCKHCKLAISYEKRYNDFCSHSCSANFNNYLRNFSSPIKENNCLFCCKKLKEKGQSKYCSRKCMYSFHWKETKSELLNTGIDNSAENIIGKRYLIELSNGKCQLCGLDKWQNQTMPLVLDHIDGNAYNNLLSNLRVICNNCDALQPTFKSRNKGNGRFKRAERYMLEKQLFKNLEGFKFRH